MQVYNDELCHYGKPGMKWGKRTATTTVTQTPTAKKQKKVVTPSKKHIAKGAKVAGKTLSIVGQNAVRLYRLNQMNKAMGVGLDAIMK